MAGAGTPKEKGAGVIRALFLFYSFIISIRAARPDKFSNFIFPASSLGCRENRQNRGLTEFSKIPATPGILKMLYSSRQTLRNS